MATAKTSDNFMADERAAEAACLPDEVADPGFRPIADTVARICAVESVTVAIANQNTPLILAQTGDHHGTQEQLLDPLLDAVLKSRTALVIDDIESHPRLKAALGNSANLKARFCAAHPLLTGDGTIVGAICLTGREPYRLSRVQRVFLNDMARVVASLLSEKRISAATQRALDKAQYAAEMASKAAETQNTHFSIALAYMSQGLCMFDGDERLVVSNNRYAEMYGLSPELMKPGTPFRTILQYRIGNNAIAGDDPERYIEERIAAVRESARSTKIQRMTDGRVLAISHAPLPGGGWVATHEDISELAKAEAMNQRLARIVEDAINEIYVFDPETLKFLQVNKSACSNLGYTLEEMQDLTPLDIKPEHTRESFEDVIAPLRAGEKTHVLFDTVHARKDGSLYNVSIALQQVRSQNQQVFTAIVEDVTERNEVLQELKQSKELFSRAFHANPLPYTISGPDGTIYDINDAWIKMMGYSREEAIGNSAYRLSLWADAEDRTNFVALLEENGIVDNYETQYRTKDGELRDVRVFGEWVDVRGEPRIFNISHDVTEHKATERRLLEDRDMLKKMVKEATSDLEAKAQELAAALAKEKELNELQRQFVSMASHEFRTPLAIIDATAQRLKKRADRMSSDDAMSRIEKIRQAVARMTQLMESTLTAARLEDGRVAVDIRPCEIERIIFDVCARHQEIAKDHVISCEMSNLPEVIRADARALEQMLANLLSNAVKYAPDAPDIRVNAYRTGDELFINVTDQGVGIDPDDIPNMFGRFFRAKTSTGIAGTGIGLNLVKTLAELHGGSVSVESTKGVGSRFIVRLPIQGPDGTQIAAA